MAFDNLLQPSHYTNETEEFKGIFHQLSEKGETLLLESPLYCDVMDNTN